MKYSHTLAKILKVLFVVGTGLWGITKLNALTPNTYYETAIPCIRFTVEDQPKLIQQAFRDVLIKLNGSEKILKNPRIIQALQSQDTYVKQFSYHENEKKEKFLLVKFEPQLINELVQDLIEMPTQAQETILPKVAEDTSETVNVAENPVDTASSTQDTKPLTAAWIVVSRDTQGPQWMGADSEQNLLDQMNQDAKQKNIPLLFPLLDLTDNALVTEQHVWDKQWTVLEDASKRYHAKALWLGKITQQSSGWHAEWTFMQAGTPILWESTHSDLATLCKDAMEELNIRLAEQGAISSVSPANTAQLPEQKINIGILGIKGIEQYNSVLDYLKKLPEVSQVEIEQVSSNQTVFSIVVKGNRETLTQAIRTGQLLVEEATSLDNKTPQNENATKSDALIYKISEVM